ncbi:MAG: GlcG protein [Caulobacteraceae bacterium]|nr:GlcG protein [Caulobacteraceae bacterium]
MTDLTHAAAQAIVAATLKYAAEHQLNPLGVVVLDARGASRALAAQDGTSLKRADVAHAKAYGALSMGMGSRSLAKRAKDHPHFVTAVGQTLGGAMIPVAGGVLIRDAGGRLQGAVGVSGDTSDNDEAAALAGIAAAGLTGDPGSD